KCRASARLRRPPLLKALPAEDRAPLRWLERNCRFGSTFRTDSPRLGANPSGPRCTFCLAVLAALRIILELLVVKEELFPGCENKFVSTIHAFQISVDEVHPASLPHRI